MPAASQPDVNGSAPTRVGFGAAFWVWARIGLLSFGGPAGQVALMHQELVEKRRWIDEERFLHALSYCTLLPGPEAQQLATYIGWLMHKTRGGLAAGLLFVLPGFVSILGLSLLYAGLGQVPAVSALFFGLKAAVLAVVIEAVLRVGKRALKSRPLIALAGAAFVAIALFGVPFPLVVLGAGLAGLLGSRFASTPLPSEQQRPEHAAGATVIDCMASSGELGHTRPSKARALRVLGVCGLCWALPLVVLRLRFGQASVYYQEGVFFSRAAVVTFGGAYAVLAYIAQEAVDTFHWLKPGEMLDGLGLAETTPGPLIMVVQFVGFMGAFRNPGSLPPLVAGVCGSLLTVWVTFVPCFLWIFLGAPYVEALRRSVPLRAALAAITAAVVGVILNLSVWFGLHVMFRQVAERHIGPIRLLIPLWSSIDVPAAVLSAAAMLALFRFKLGLPKTLACSALAGMAWQLLTQ